MTELTIGLGAPISGAWATPENLVRVAAEAEELGYASLWTLQRLLVGTDQDLHPVYHSVLDPVAALAFAAARTSRIRLGIGVINLPFVPPAYLAKQAATLDVLSGGRLDLGLGVGWSPAEFAASGASTERRGPRTVEYVQVLHTLWADEVSEFDGEFYTVPPSRMLPKPVQRPGPPVLLGGGVPAALQRAGRIADGWISSSGADLRRLADDVALVHKGAEEAGKDPAAVRVIVRGVVRVDGPADRLLSGPYDKIREDAAWLAGQGVTELFYDLNYDRAIGSPEADPAAGLDRALTILHALRP
ncbi:TIGR03619 family F420-dependent LLM class oxidoreductase [Pseudonocardia cypriaca]|uniref:Putative F420-dependent oxidoreductase n=1 Tax=Pseudonocardia cypriaca TaxID=882449 RepID=A0A543GGD7_9PSEU|nr:TIGR03619 family F420-dependent LLM class oxidoreductase [Pseudonocardia cypriaca]TQM45150.1 putative F420-dependent oxidoreductase [Pseudonocardia cypriaca]